MRDIFLSINIKLLKLDLYLTQTNTYEIVYTELWVNFPYLNLNVDVIDNCHKS